MWASQTFLVFDGLDRLGSTAQEVCRMRMSFNFGWSDILFMVWQGYRTGGGEPTCAFAILITLYKGFSSVTQSRPTLCDPMNHSTPGLPVHHQIPESTQTHVHCVSDAIQPSHPLSPPSPPALNRSQHQGLFQWVSSSHQVAKVLEFQLQHKSFQWIPRTDFL